MTPLKAILLRLHWSLGMSLFVPATEIVQGYPLAGVVTCCCFQSWSTSTTRAILGDSMNEKSLFLTPNEVGGALRQTRRECEPTVTWVDPHTNVTVIILGCLHGSPSSNADLENILRQNRPAALVLELCTTRYLNIVKEKQRWKTNKKSILQQKDYSSSISGGTSRASILLGIASDFQTSFSGFEPGLEFKYAIEYVDNLTSKDKDKSELGECCDIILADRDVSETLRRLEDLPEISFQSFLQLIKEQNSAELFHLQTAIWGDNKFQISTTRAASSMLGDTQIDVGKVLFRSPRAIQDLCQSTILPLTLISISVYSLMSLTQYFFLSLLWDATSTSITSHVEHAFLYATLSIVLFVFLALPLTKIMLLERDQHLARGIIDACQVVQSRKISSSATCDEMKNGTSPTIVVILGLLHVNNVAKKLLQKSEGMSPFTKS